VERIAREVAAHIELKLEQQLVTRYGPNWLAAVNEQIPEGKKIRSLSDHRSCLAVFGHNRATAGWVSEDQREMARELSKLASKAHHDHSLTYRDVARARSIGAILRKFDESPRRLYGRPNPTRNTS
jgi:hypothetical protein